MFSTVFRLAVNRCSIDNDVGNCDAARVRKCFIVLCLVAYRFKPVLFSVISAFININLLIVDWADEPRRQALITLFSEHEKLAFSQKQKNSKKICSSFVIESRTKFHTEFQFQAHIYPTNVIFFLLLLFCLFLIQYWCLHNSDIILSMRLLGTGGRAHTTKLTLK